MPVRWILISNASNARLYRDGSPTKPFSLHGSFEHPESRAKVRDLTTDMNGRKPSGGNGFARPGAEPDTDPKQVEAQKFARELARELSTGLEEHAYDEVVIAAPPHFLGLLRHAVSTEVERHLIVTLDKDLTHLAERDMERVVRDELHRKVGPGVT